MSSPVQTDGPRLRSLSEGHRMCAARCDKLLHDQDPHEVDGNTPVDDQLRGSGLLNPCEGPGAWL